MNGSEKLASALDEEKRKDRMSDSNLVLGKKGENYEQKHGSF